MTLASFSRPEGLAWSLRETSLNEDLIGHWEKENGKLFRVFHILRRKIIRVLIELNLRNSSEDY